jgi:hypothetical protein
MGGPGTVLRSGLCALCRAPYSAFSLNRKYCSNACRVRAQQVKAGVRPLGSVQRQCAVCCGAFSPRTQNQVVCGSECRRLHDRDRDRHKKVEGKRQAKARKVEGLAPAAEVAQAARMQAQAKQADKRAAFRRTLACNTCTSGIPFAESETGVACLRECYSACKPHSEARFYTRAVAK